MKHFSQTPHPSQQIFAALVLGSIVSLGSGITLVDAAIANPAKSPQSVANLKQSRTNQLPNSVINAIRRDIIRRTRPPHGQWKVVSFKQQTWSDSCLGLRQPDEVCGQVVIENGWRVVMSNGRQNLTYRTDATGRIVRLEGQGSSGSSGLPGSVANVVLRTASQRTGLSTSQLRIVESESRTWPDGCLGLGGPGVGCTQAMVPGWQVIVDGGQQRLVFRTNKTGSQVNLDEKASRIVDANLPSTVAKAVLQAASQRTGLSTSQLRIIESERREWSDGCLGLDGSDVSCTTAIVPGRQVIVEGGQQRLVFRTNETGSQIKLDEKASRIVDANLPKSVANAVFQAASQRTGLSTSQLRIVKHEQMMTDGCLNLPRPNEPCPEIGVSAWEVTVEGGQQRLVYRSDGKGSQVRLNEKASSISDTKLPSAVAKAVLQAASQRSGLSTSQLRIVESQQTQGSSSCLGIPPRPDEVCTMDLAPLWQVTVADGRQRLVYHSNMNGSRIRLNEEASSIGEANLPDAVANAVLQAASQRTGLRASELRIVQSQQIQGSSSCLAVPRADEACTRDLALLWQVTVEGGRQRLVYHTNMDGSRIRLNEDASSIGNINLPNGVVGAVPIPPSELPPPLPQDAIFRVITSGGFAGRTEETILLNNGQMIKRDIAPNIPGSTAKTISVSPERLQQFKRLLEQQPMAQYSSLSYPAPIGAADYITVTFTSKDGTTRYVDMVQNQLPKPLQLVMLTWNSMTNGR